MIKLAEYAKRRRHLLQMAGPDAVVVLAAASEKIRNHDVYHPYRQDSDFLYLTGFSEPDAVLVLTPQGKHGTCTMFCRPRDPKREMWDGPMAGTEGVVADFGMDKAYPIAELDRRLPELIAGHEKIIYNMGRDTVFDQKILACINELRQRKGVHAPDELVAVDHDLHEMRMVKSKAELTAMRRSAKVAVEAHERAIQACNVQLNEADIEAEIQHTFIRHHCQPSYLPIVGAGANACILHYIANNQPLQDGQLLLIDAGAEYQGYASDVTRTFPVNGRFSAEQKALYDVVLASQLAAIDQIRPGKQWQDVQDASVRVITEGLIDLGLLSGELDEQIENQGYKQFYVHNVGHWLGLDVHDVGDYQVDGHSRALEPGMVMTVEPGIYIPPDCEAVDKVWRGIGIRIEDDVAVTKEQPDVLSGALIKTVDDIEAAMAA